MTTEEQIAQRLETYAQMFDMYIEQTGTPPPPKGELQPFPDPLAEYLRETTADPFNAQHCKDDEEWRESLKSSLMEFFRNMLALYIPLETAQQNELLFIGQFAGAGLPGKRQMWRMVIDAISNQYTEAEINLKGYALQLQEAKEEQYSDIFDALTSQWKQCSEKHLQEAKQRLLNQRRKQFEIQCNEWGKEDYESALKSKEIVFQYPQLREIVEIIGRDKQENKTLKDCTITHYQPFLLSPSVAAEDIDGVCLSNHIPSALPAELVYLSDPQSEDLFFLHFANSQLQSFSSKPPTDSRKRTEHVRQETPRLIKGPIIVSVDTSGSMDGKPLDTSLALLHQLLLLARKQHRPCYLITYSIHSQAIDLADYANRRKVKDFLKNGFSGGTDGNQMLHCAIDALHKKQYEMADVLIISDFYWEKPNAKNLEQMHKEQTLGTRFYGLCMNGNSKPHKWLNRVWQVKL